ncbi:16S rRNA (uracil(1498)-N(3))-methyltransferase [Leptolyngbya sp. AN02str]|uniref:16S rRNA (uracil(1498)-N(3))-methyltransferase n=1 Tax=Leptolyngbya sp. AN02str TaxID=3423363 RepID=UPI003D314AC1
MDYKHLQRVAIAPHQLEPPLVHLTAAQQRYLLRVLRLGVGDGFIVMDGYQWWLSELVTATSARLLEVIPAQTELPVELVMLVSMPKGNGMDDIVRQCTELGVAAIVPVVSDRTLLQPSPKKVERWQRIAQEAAEQSERLMIPTMHEPMAWKAGLEHWSVPSVAGYMCVARGDVPHLLTCLNPTFLNQQQQKTPLQTVAIATGPEGGWTDYEIQAAHSTGYRSVSLGRRILRAVTAPMVAAALVAASYEAIATDANRIAPSASAD